MQPITTRFCPSPTGYIHVGNVRAALFPWLLAKQTNGTFILRIEDTDQARFVEGATDLIVDTLRWLGIDWNEGYLVGGEHGPYIQSERKEIYNIWAQKLIDKGLAYADPYTAEEVQAFREQAKAAKKAFLYRDFRPTNPPKWDGSQPLRFKVTNIKRYDWHDPIMGDLSAGPEALDDFIIIKSDSLPTYNFAHIIDDYLMNVTYIIRGLEYISSIPKYLSLYEALELPVPVLACMPHIMAADGKKKLGKRDGAKSVNEYREQGILPDAMINFLASLGWNDGTEQEIFSRDELIDKFRLDRVQRSGARFDEQRLLWMNGYYIRQLSAESLLNYCQPYLSDSANDFDEKYQVKVLQLLQERLKYFAELPELTNYFFADPAVDLELISNNKQLSHFSHKELGDLLKKSCAALESSEWNVSSIQESLNNLLIATDQKPGILFSLIRIAVSWAPSSPGLADTLEVLGKDISLARLKQAQNLLMK